MASTSYGTLPTISCCLCGARIQANGANMCQGCLGDRFKITAPLDALHLELLMCKRCGRWRTSQNGHKEYWAPAELESLELMALCLKQGPSHALTKGGLTLVDSRWEWTEPHCRRLKIRATVRKTLDEFRDVTLQSVAVLEYRINTRQCNDCAADNSTGAGEPWRAVVQLRQRVDGNHKTLARLEQDAAKSSDVMSHCLGIKECKDGLDLYFGAFLTQAGSGQRASLNHHKLRPLVHSTLSCVLHICLCTATETQAVKLVEFCKSSVPARCSSSKKVVSQDKNSNIDHIKYTFIVEVLPLCRDDLVALPAASSLRGKLPGLWLVIKVGLRGDGKCRGENRWWRD